MKRYVYVLFLAALMLVLLTAPAGAIVGGTPDTDNTYNNVGMILFYDHEGEYWNLDGSCTLVRNDEGGVIVLTAAHCVDWVDDPTQDLIVTFESMTDKVPGDMPDEYYGVKQAAIHPDYLDALETTPYIGNSKRFGIGPGREDVALLWLDVDGPLPGIEPVPVVREGGLSGLNLKRETFTVVGYGINSFVAGSFMSWHNPNTWATWSGRNYTDVSVVSTHDAFGDRYLKVTESTAFGDSGGPTFYDGPENGDTVVAVTVWGGSMRCQGPAYQYRLDTESAWGFLGEYLGSAE